MRSLMDATVVDEVKSQWKRMWQERFDDHARAQELPVTVTKSCSSRKPLFFLLLAILRF